MSHKLLLRGMLSLVSLVSISVFAQSRAPQVPLSIEENCLLNEHNLIDECPEYREDIRTINLTLEKQRQQARASGSDVLATQLIEDLENFGDPYTESQQITTKEMFLNDYRLYITQELQKFINNNPQVTNPITAFFEISYFDMDQSGLALVGFSFYNDRVPTQYDTTIDLLISLRNFSAQKIDTIEGIYCFSTTKGRDYMYPVFIQPQVDAHSINNLVLSIDIKHSPFLEKIEKKGLACLVAYTKNNGTHYTDRGKIIFDLKK